MKQKVFLTIIMAFAVIVGQAKSSDYYVVQRYLDNLDSYCSSKNSNYLKNLRDCCDKRAFISDDWSKDLDNRMVKMRDSELSSFLLDLEQHVRNEQIEIDFSNIKEEKNVTANRCQDKHKKGRYTYFTSSITVHNNLSNYGTNTSKSKTYHEVFYVYNGKIKKIAKDQRDDKGRLILDLSDFEDGSWGLTYNYAKDWPIGVSVMYSPGDWFMGSVDVGVNTSKEKFNTSKLNMTDIMNYSLKRTKSNPQAYLTVTPQFFYRYFSVGCGVGMLYMSTTKYENKEANSITSSPITVGTSSAVSENGSKFKFMLRPTVKGFIPISSSIKIAVSVSYNYAFGFKDYNGIDFGIGAIFPIY